jgi:hypothetical protein
MIDHTPFNLIPRNILYFSESVTKKHYVMMFYGPVRIRARIGPPRPHACRKTRLNGAVLRMRPDKPRSRVGVCVSVHGFFVILKIFLATIHT